MLEHVLFSLRMRAGLTKHDVAQRAAIADSYLCMLEQGLRLPSRKMVPRLAEALDTSPEILLQALQADRLQAMGQRGTTGAPLGQALLLLLLQGLSLC